MHSFSTDQPRRHYRYILIGIAAATVTSLAARISLLAAIPTGTIATILYVAFSKRLWKHSILRRIGLVEVPDLNGTWEGYIYTSAPEERIDDELIVERDVGDGNFTKMEASLHIEQTWDQIQIDLNGPESTSHSEAATILLGDSSYPTLNYNYENPGSSTNEELGMHYGTTTLQLYAGDDCLKGPYFTNPDRDRHGKLEVWR